ncbi:sensor histidine kinase [Leptospira wolffii]|uniref:sensor histidine kinase n=1 Tax=Leptospira wolffii TaxID=409998 RepID=UPI0010832626|nr:sensor histidine kinase [Leptospira wolffii]TGL45416.1 sensor histidine kinase [Leptospira wolffii]
MLNWMDRVYADAESMARNRAKPLFLFDFILLLSGFTTQIISFPRFRPGFFITSIACAFSLYLISRGKYRIAANLTLIGCVIAITVGIFFGVPTDSRSYSIAIVVLLFLYFGDIRKTILVSVYCLFLLLVEGYWDFTKGRFQWMAIADRLILHTIFSSIAILIVKLLHNYIEEKDNLIKEIHHRVRNNMQVLSGLVELHKKEDYPTGILEDFHRRMLSISEVQNAIYKSDSYNEINFLGVGKEIVASISEKSNIPGLKIDLQMENLNLRVDKAIPLAMILSELLSNASAHGSRDGIHCEVTVRFEKTEGVYKLQIKDKGNGIQDWKIWTRPKTIGFTLVQILSRQLKGVFNIYNDEGICAVVQFDA